MEKCNYTEGHDCRTPHDTNCVPHVQNVSEFDAKPNVNGNYVCILPTLIPNE